MNPSPLLEIENLCVTFGTSAPVEVVTDVSFSLARGEVLGLIGEFGSGKTVTGLSILRLLPDIAHSRASCLRYAGREISRLSEREFDALRGHEMAMIFQDPVGAFNPVKTIRWHLRNAFHGTGTIRNSNEGLDQLLIEVEIRDPDRVLNSFPHQLSGGMLQRVLIAMVFALHPSLVIADEPTTNLDNIVEGQILALIRERQRRLQTSLIFITHDLTIAGSICDRIAVMYGGEIVEIGSSRDILERPRHPYTIGLLNTARSLVRGDPVLFEIAGEPGSRAIGEACGFSSRCSDAIGQCSAVHPALVYSVPGAGVRCIRHDH